MIPEIMETNLQECFEYKLGNNMLRDSENFKDC